LATAHNADDNFETVLFRMTRKTGVTGLCGIPERRGKYIRPLLYCSRAEVEKFCRENGVPFVTDSTNLSDDFTRNRLRHSVVPIMKTLNPSLLASFEKTLELLKSDSDYLESQANKEFEKRFDGEKLDVREFSLLHKAISSRVIANFLDHFGHSGNYSVNSALKIAVNGGRTELKNGEMLKSKDGYLGFEKNKSVTFSVTFNEEIGNPKKENGKIHNLLLKNAIDCDKIVGSLKIRTRLGGDSISFSHRKVSKSLRKWMNEEKIEPSLRDILPVIADDLGAVWVYGGGVDSRVCVDENTQRYVKVICEKMEN
jgi:tRNA(Ile)-lysidine synthase